MTITNAGIRLVGEGNDRRAHARVPIEYHAIDVFADQRDEMLREEVGDRAGRSGRAVGWWVSAPLDG